MQSLVILDCLTVVLCSVCGTDGRFGHALHTLVSRSALGLSVENQPGSVVKEEVTENLFSGISFLVRDAKELHRYGKSHKWDPRYYRPE